MNEQDAGQAALQMQRQKALDSRQVVLNAAVDGFKTALASPQPGRPIAVRVAMTTVEKTTVSVIGANSQQLSAANNVAKRAGVDQARRVV